MLLALIFQKLIFWKSHNEMIVPSYFHYCFTFGHETMLTILLIENEKILHYQSFYFNVKFLFW